jgi:hypothetical protein
VSRGLPFLCVAALAACGGTTEVASGPAYVNKAKLATMVLPEDELGALAEGLEVAADDSGWTSHRKAAKETLDPEDSAASLSARGRVAGYELTYENPRSRGRSGLLLVETSVDLMRDEIYAAELLDKHVHDFEDREGLSHAGVKLVRVALFDVPGAGDEAAGVRAVLRAERRKVYYTLAFLRRGRILGAAGILQADERRVDAEVLGLAKALDRRIQGVLAGELEDEPVLLARS